MADKKDRKAEAALQGFGQGASFGFLDELAGLAASTGTTLPAFLAVLEGKNPFTDQEAFDSAYERLYGIPAEKMLTKEAYTMGRDASRMTKGMPRDAALEREALLLGQTLSESLPQSMSREEDEFKRLLSNLGVLESQ